MRLPATARPMVLGAKHRLSRVRLVHIWAFHPAASCTARLCHTMQPLDEQTCQHSTALALTGQRGSRAPLATSSGRGAIAGRDQSESYSCHSAERLDLKLHTSQSCSHHTLVDACGQQLLRATTPSLRCPLSFHRAAIAQPYLKVHVSAVKSKLRSTHGSGLRGGRASSLSHCPALKHARAWMHRSPQEHLLSMRSPSSSSSRTVHTTSANAPL